MRIATRISRGTAVFVLLVLLVTVLQAQTSFPAGSRDLALGGGTHMTDTTCCYAYWDTVYQCDFEIGSPCQGDWTVSDGHWMIDRAPQPPGPHSGDYCAFIDTTAAGTYPPNVNSRLITGWQGATIDLPTLAPGEELQLIFYHWFSFAGGDWGRVEIGIGAEPSHYDPIPGHYALYSGDSHGWYSPPHIDLSAYAGMSVRIAFHFYSDDGSYGGESRGWFPDDVVIRKGWDPYWTSLESPNWESWAGGLQGWIADDALWEVGVTSNPGPCSGRCSGGPCAATRLAENYWPNADARLISPPIHLGDTPCYLGFVQWFSFAGGDWGRVEIAPVIGHDWGTWQSLTTFSGDSGGWRKGIQAASISLAGYVNSTVRIAFHFYSDDGSYGGESRGWLVDDIQISSVVTDVGDARLPSVLALHQNVPNPFNPTTTIRFSTPSAGMASLVVLDVAGRHVRTLLEGILPPGEHQHVWDGRDQRGDAARSGVYLYRLRTPEGTSTRRMVLIH